MNDVERMELLYKHSLNLAKNPPLQTFSFDQHKSAIEKFNNLERWEKIARATAYAIVNQRVFVEPYDNIIGHTFYSNEKPIEKFDDDFNYNQPNGIKAKENPEYAELCEYKITGWGIPGHVAWNWNYILQYGTKGLKQAVNRGLERHVGDKKAFEFYNGVLILIDALEKWNDLHVEQLEKLGKTKLAQICKRVPRYPARTFHEAVQSFFMQHIVVMKECPNGGNSPGRLDYYLWPYLERDLQNGTCTMQQAQDLIEELFIRIDERLYHIDTWGESIVVGGTFVNGQSAVNPLTYVMIKAYMKYNITHPFMYARIPENPPKDYVELCAKYVMQGNNRAQIINDKSVISALVKNGVSVNDAVDYFCGGCMEIAIQGRTSDFLFTGMHSISQILEFCITGGYSLINQKQLNYLKLPSLENFNSFEDFYAHFICVAKDMLYMHLKHMDTLSEHAEISRPCYLLSSMIDDCLSVGRNMHGGGARYHDYGAALMGLPNTADSLYAIKRAVFEDGICSANELIRALKANFEGFDKLRNKLLAIPKYGQDNPEADAMMNRVTSDICNAYLSYINRFGGYGKPVILSFVWAPWVGAILGATPDGRKAGVPVAQAITPQSMAMNKGITSAMNSCSVLDFNLFPGGATTMWDLDSTWANEQVVEWLMTAFFKQGGQFFQGNVTDVETLIKAQKNPENYPNLIVRVGGFSARFVNLAKDIQDDVINRIRHKG